MIRSCLYRDKVTPVRPGVPFSFFDKASRLRTAIVERVKKKNEKSDISGGSQPYIHVRTIAQSYPFCFREWSVRAAERFFSKTEERVAEVGVAEEGEGRMKP